eukprot:evm.model.scf_642.2 EVM.evm.TU.scf_642.2   scf_642:20316-22340(-)
MAAGGSSYISVWKLTWKWLPSQFFGNSSSNDRMMHAALASFDWPRQAVLDKSHYGLSAAIVVSISGMDFNQFLCAYQEGWMPGDAEVFHQLWGKPPSRTSSANVKGPAILVANKMDKAGDFSAASLPLVVKEQFGQIVTTCALESKGLDALEDAMMAVLGVEQVSSQGHGWAVNQRQCEALVRAHESLMKVSETINQDLPIDFWTIDLRGALVSLGEVTGDEVTEEILDAVFGNFCIGK